MLNNLKSDIENISKLNQNNQKYIQQYYISSGIFLGLLSFLLSIYFNDASIRYISLSQILNPLGALMSNISAGFFTVIIFYWITQKRHDGAQERHRLYDTAERLFMYQTSSYLARDKVWRQIIHRRRIARDLLKRATANKNANRLELLNSVLKIHKNNSADIQLTQNSFHLEKLLLNQILVSPEMSKDLVDMFNKLFETVETSQRAYNEISANIENDIKETKQLIQISSLDLSDNKSS